ncbi:MAG: TraR/DksA C4-type zinc finger protein [Pirellulaceae bacterium]|jgi:DnaK suppressor protein|nr:TraR/DksA C4-type zinc finger protein [Pirellulaceae bacterium]
MKKLEMRPFKKILIGLRARLQGDVNALADAALGSTAEAQGELSSLPSHLADLGSDTFEQDNTLRLMDNEEVVLEQIESALERIENGIYGNCIECEGRIPKMRLNVIPYTPLCVKCANNLEDDDNWN